MLGMCVEWRAESDQETLELTQKMAAEKKALIGTQPFERFELVLCLVCACHFCVHAAFG